MENTFQFTENERLLLIFALGAAHGIPAIVADHTAPPATTVELARRLITGQSIPPVMTPQPQGTVTPAPAAVRQEIPEGAIELSITPLNIVKTGEGKRERLLVKWRSGNAECLANCWVDQKPIWPRVLERVRKPSVFYAKKSGEYLNIVGVK